MMGQRPTVEELEKLLNSEDDEPLQVLPDGTVNGPPKVKSWFEKFIRWRRKINDY